MRHSLTALIDSHGWITRSFDSLAALQGSEALDLCHCLVIDDQRVRFALRDVIDIVENRPQSIFTVLLSGGRATRPPALRGSEGVVILEKPVQGSALVQAIAEGLGAGPHLPANT